MNAIKYLKNDNVMKLVMFFIYFTVNLLFIIKYGVRQDKIPVSFLVAFFFFIHILIYKYDKFFVNELKITKTFLSLFLGVVLSVFIFIGQMPSYLPGQLLAAVGFYLMGNVGYLQVAAFILFVVAAFRFFSNNIRFITIFLLTVSLSFIYEVLCKSDFISSFILTIAFIIFWYKKFSYNYFAKPLLLGVILGILCLTRSLVIIPLILFLLNPFFNADNSEKLKVVIGFLISFSVLLATVILPVESFKYLKEYNPLRTQGQGNGYIMMFFLVVTVIISKHVKNIQQVFFYSAMIYFLLIGSFLIESVLNGIAYNNLGITYLAASLPFSIMGYSYITSKNLKEKFHK